jgi:hypothetical protein
MSRVRESRPLTSSRACAKSCSGCSTNAGCCYLRRAGLGGVRYHSRSARRSYGGVRGSASHQAHLHEALHQLRANGLLLVQDALLPCVTSIVAGRPVRGSWLGDPSARGTYAVLVALEAHPEVLQTKLVAGKVTMVHHDLWPAVLGVAISHAAWQFEQMSPVSRWLFDAVDRQGSVQTDLVPLLDGITRKDIPSAARELERRLLVQVTEVHTPSGAHATHTTSACSSRASTSGYNSR